MIRALQTAFAAAALTGFSLYIWREGYIYTDLAILALVPLALVIWAGCWPLALQPCRARLRIVLRNESPLGRVLTGRLRAFVLSGIFTFVAVTLLAWQAWTVSLTEVLVLSAAFFLSAVLFSVGQNVLSAHFHQPFANSIATSVVTWLVAVPFTLIIAWTTWAWAKMPGEMLNANIYGAVLSGVSELPDRGGWIAAILSVPSGYEAAKLWAVVQLRDYPIIGTLFSLDAALFAFVLCRSAIVIAQFIEKHIAKAKV
jgi:hypothetical protein